MILFLTHGGKKVHVSTAVATLSRFLTTSNFSFLNALLAQSLSLFKPFLSAFFSSALLVVLFFMFMFFVFVFARRSDVVVILFMFVL